MSHHEPVYMLNLLGFKMRAGYLEIHGHRSAALANSRLIACEPFRLG